MARYFFHVRDGSDYLLDPDGTHFETLELAKAATLRAARDTLSHDIRQGLIDLRLRIDLENDHGIVVHAIALGDAFTVIPAES